MEPEESEENSSNRKNQPENMQQKSSWKPVISEFAIATFVFVSCVLILFLAIVCVLLVALGWMSYTMFFFMVCIMIGCLVIISFDPCSLMLAKRIKKRRRSSGKGFGDEGTWTEMNSLVPATKPSMKKHRRRKNKNSSLASGRGIVQKPQEKIVSLLDPSPDPFVSSSSSTNLEEAAG